VETNYANTDFDLRSPVAFDELDAELSTLCCKLQYDRAPDGVWWASYEANQLNDSAENDISAFLAAIDELSETARSQLSSCTKRDFNIGFHCWDSWAYNLHLPRTLVAAVANSAASISITLYPMREPDGTPKIDTDGG